MKHHAALPLLLGLAAAGAAEDTAQEVRQAVIRAPEMAVVDIMADAATHPTEAARVAVLWQAVQAGKARVVSDLTSRADAAGKVFARQGRHVWLPSELEQDTERLQMPPTAQEEHFVGTALTAAATGHGSPTFQWQAVCVPRGPALVKWPVSWLNLWINHEPDPQKRLIRGWLDFHDTFQQESVGAVTLRSARMQILAIMPPGDQVPLSPEDRASAGPGRWLDVFLAQVKAPGQPPPEGPEPEPGPAPMPAVGPVPADPFAPLSPHPPQAVKPLPQGQAGMFYGISIGAAEAATLLRTRDPADDATLLQKLLARVRAGSARLRLCVGSGHDPQTRHAIRSARLHQVPTEMPSIPSAWEAMPLGTTLEMEMENFDLHQDLAPPGRTEWKLALDDPKAVMWQPRPRFMRLQGGTPSLRGTHLLGLLHIPEVMRQPGTGLEDKEPQSILIFGQHHGGHLTADDRGGQQDERPALEAELIVLEMPGASVEDFEGLPGDPQAGDEAEEDRYRQLMDRVATGEVRIAAHTLVIGGHHRAQARLVEEHKHATEFDPPEEKDVPRMRPTALETIHAGTEFEIDATCNNAPPFEIFVDFTFKHSTGLPVEPGLPATLATAAKDENGPYPFGEHPQEAWTSSDRHATTGSSGYVLRDDKPFCLGARKPEGLGRKVIHVAYLRVRRL